MHILDILLQKELCFHCIGGIIKESRWKTKLTKILYQYVIVIFCFLFDCLKQVGLTGSFQCSIAAT